MFKVLHSLRFLKPNRLRFWTQTWSWLQRLFIQPMMMKLITKMSTGSIKSIFFQTHVDWGRNLYYVRKLGNVKTQKNEILPIVRNPWNDAWLPSSLHSCWLVWMNQLIMTQNEKEKKLVMIYYTPFKHKMYLDESGTTYCACLVLTLVR